MFNRSELEPLGLSGAQLSALRRAVKHLHRWYEGRARELPWRETRDPYAIWVSEVMLQQTQVATVIPYYRRWMERLPTVEALAGSDEAAVLLLWEGLGYYRRARHLHHAAQKVVAEHGGRVPARLEEMRALPGVGAYTAAAVLSIAFDQPLAVVDGNVRRALSRLVALEARSDRAPASRALDALAQHLLLPGAPGQHNQAMMELGALVCTPRSPGCELCPLRGACKGHQAGTPERFPARAPARRVPHQDLAVGVVRRGERLLLFRRPYGGLLAGLWDFPSREIPPAKATAVDRNAAKRVLRRMLRERYAVDVTVDEALPAIKHAYTHLKVTLHPFDCQVRSVQRARRAAEDDGWRWLKAAELSGFAMTRASQKVLELLDAV